MAPDRQIQLNMGLGLSERAPQAEPAAVSGCRTYLLRSEARMLEGVGGSDDSTEDKRRQGRHVGDV